MHDTPNPVEIAEDKDLTIAQLHANFHNYQVTAVARYQELEDKYDALVTKQLETPVFNVESLVNKYVTDLVGSLLEGNDIRALIEQAIDSQVERILEQPDFVSDHVEEAIRQAIDCAEIDCEDTVEKAIVDALENVELKFNPRRY